MKTKKIYQSIDHTVTELEEKIELLDKQFGGVHPIYGEMNKLISSLRKQVDEIKNMNTPNKPIKEISNCELFQIIIHKLETSQIYFEGDGHQWFLLDGKYEIKIGELEMEFKNHNGYEGEDWNRKFKEQLEKEKSVLRD